MNSPIQNNVEIMITNISLKGDGFAILSDGGQGVYIPPSVTKASDILPGELRKATLVENDPDRGNLTEFKAIFIMNPNIADEAKASDQPSDLEERIIEALEDAESYLTTREVAREIGVEVLVARDRLNKLFTANRVARADIFYQSNRRASNVLWAIAPDDFL